MRNLKTLKMMTIKMTNRKILQRKKWILVKEEI